MNLKYYLWLNSIKGISAVHIARLINYFGDAKNVYENDDTNLYKQVSGIGDITAVNIAKNKDLSKISQKLSYIEENGVKYITYENDFYPVLLKQIYDAPPILYYKGENLFKGSSPAVAVVGARNSTPYGNDVARSLAKDLASSGVCVVSGLARGIDKSAHEGSLEAGGDTIAVLGNGINVVYPKENAYLYDRIIQSGNMIISEFDPTQEPTNFLFPIRNRIISGLSFGSVIVQASYSSGSLITAKCALEQNREIYAVPGDITNPLSAGTNRLLKEGAKPITCANDILEDLFSLLKPIAMPYENKKEPIVLSKDESLLLKEVSEGINTPDALSVKLNFSAQKISTLITMLELKQVITVKMGVVYATHRR